MTLKSNVYIFPAKTFKRTKQPQASQVALMNRTTENSTAHANFNEQGNAHTALRMGMLKTTMQVILYIAKSFRDRNKLGKLTSSKSEVRPFECHFQRIDYLPLGV